MEIVFNIDDGYVQPCAATLNSVIRNNPGSAIGFHVITTGLSAENEAVLAGISARAGHRLSVYRTDETSAVHLPNLGKHHHVSAAAYLRLFMAGILPEHIDKALYLDCDLLVRTSLAPLWETDLTGRALAAVEDAPIPGVQERLGYDGRYPYFNSGVMLVDLYHWRSHGVQERLTDWLERHPDRIVHHDQDVLNAVLHEGVHFLDIGWNMMRCFFRDPPRIAPRYLDLLPQRRLGPMIVHFTGRDKPWTGRTDHPFAREYFEYLRGTPWEGFRLTGREIRRQRGVGGWLGNLFEQWGRRTKRLLKRQCR